MRALALCVGAGGGAQAQDAPQRVRCATRSAYEDLQMFGQVLNQIRVNHPDSVDMHELFMAAVRGMVHAADPHSYVITAMRLEPGKEEALRDGELHPGADLLRVRGRRARGGERGRGHGRRAQLDILAGDELLAIDGAPVTATSADELEIVLAGPKKSTVALTFERRRSGRHARAARARGDAASGSTTRAAVPVAMMLDSSTGYVRVTTFMGERVADDLHAALERLEQAGMKRLVLDLRDNGGGSVREARTWRASSCRAARSCTRPSGRKADDHRHGAGEALASGAASGAIRSS